MTSASAERDYLIYDPHSCGNPACDGDEDACREAWEALSEQDAIDWADSIRKGEW